MDIFMAEEIILYPLIVLYEVLLMICIIQYLIDQKFKNFFNRAKR